MDGQDNTPKGEPRRADYKGKIGMCIANAVEAATPAGGKLEVSRGEAPLTPATLHNPNEEVTFMGKTGRKTIEGTVIGAYGQDADSFKIVVKDVGLINSITGSIDDALAVPVHSTHENYAENYGAGIAEGNIRNGKITDTDYRTLEQGHGPLSNKSEAEAGLKQVATIEKQVETCMASSGTPSIPKRQFKPSGP